MAMAFIAVKLADALRKRVTHPLPDRFGARLCPQPECESLGCEAVQYDGAEFYEGKGTIDLMCRVSHEGILIAVDWREGADAVNAWLGTNKLDTVRE